MHIFCVNMYTVPPECSKLDSMYNLLGIAQACPKYLVILHSTKEKFNSENFDKQSSDKLIVGFKQETILVV